MSNFNDEMKAAANYTIKAAKEKFGQELDFSEQSIVKLEGFLEQAYQSLSSRVKDEKTSNSIIRTANAWGSYLGEYMRLKWGGTWILKDSERILSIKNIEFSPIGFVYQKITSHPEYSVKNYFAETERKVSPPPVVLPQSQKISESLIQPIEQISSNQPQNTVTIDKKLIFAIGGIGGILLIAVACIVGFMVFSKSGVTAETKKDDVSAEFKSNLNVFLLEAEKLNILTEQGVTNSDFRNQFAEVKLSYMLIKDTFPASFATEKKSFDQAIKGWELALEVWDGSLVSELPIMSSESTILIELATYTNTATPAPGSSDWSEYLSYDRWIEKLLGKASDYFKQGKMGTDSKLK